MGVNWASVNSLLLALQTGGSGKTQVSDGGERRSRHGKIHPDRQLGKAFQCRESRGEGHQSLYWQQWTEQRCASLIEKVYNRTERGILR